MMSVIDHDKIVGWGGKSSYMAGRNILEREAEQIARKVRFMMLLTIYGNFVVRCCE